MRKKAVVLRLRGELVKSPLCSSASSRRSLIALTGASLPLSLCLLVLQFDRRMRRCEEKFRFPPNATSTAAVGNVRFTSTPAVPERPWEGQESALLRQSQSPRRLPSSADWARQWVNREGLCISTPTRLARSPGPTKSVGGYLGLPFAEQDDTNIPSRARRTNFDDP
jgi:hypothetical protein